MDKYEVCEKENARLNNKRVTIFALREDGLFAGKFSADGWNASNEKCLSAALENIMMHEDEED